MQNRFLDFGDQLEVDQDNFNGLGPAAEPNIDFVND